MMGGSLLATDTWWPGVVTEPERAGFPRDPVVSTGTFPEWHLSTWGWQRMTPRPGRGSSGRRVPARLGSNRREWAEEQLPKLCSDVCRQDGNICLLLTCVFCVSRGRECLLLLSERQQGYFRRETSCPSAMCRFTSLGSLAMALG